VRVGDIIDYAYSVNGENPILGGRFVNTLLLGLSQPIRLLRCRLLWPAGRTLQLRNQNADVQPTIRQGGQEREYLWERSQAPALEIEDDTPDWFNPVPRVQLSEFATWEEVARWAVPLYAVGRPFSPELTKQIERWRAESAEPEARFLAALHFVQDEVRYLGIELGPHSHLPHSPSSVYARRFGDCKDKSLLLSTALNALGIEAYPALVNTKVRHVLNTWQPSPFAFDHVIVQAKLGGQTYWIDPTVSLQRGGLSQFYNPDYARALVVREDSRELQEIPQPASYATGITIKEVYTADKLDAPATLEVVTTYLGGQADEMRYRLAQQPLAELGKKYLNYYAANYPSIAADSLPQVLDDPGQNAIVITEQYRIPNFWPEQSQYFFAGRINEELSKPKISRRTQPLSVTHPTAIAQTIEIHTPPGFRIAADSGTIEDEAMRLQYQYTLSNKVIKLDYRFQTRRDHVPAQQVAKHLETIDKIQQAISYRLTRGDAQPGEVSAWALGAVCSLTGLPLIIFGLIRGVRWSRAHRRRKRFTRSRQLAPGAGPETAIRVAVGEDLRRHLHRLRCSCGLPYDRPDAPLQQEGVIFDGQRLTLVHLKCEKCGDGQALYFNRLQADAAHAGGRDGRNGS